MKSFRISQVIFTFLLLTATASSTSKVDKKVSQEAAQEPVQNTTQAQKRTADLINESPDLTGEQKTKLLALQNQVRTQLETNGKDGLKFRELLVEKILSKKYKSGEVEIVKNKIRDLEKKRVANLFDSVDKANEILGRASVNNQRMLRDFVDPRENIFY